MYTLYYSPGACSMAVHVALIECKAPVTLNKVDVSAGEQRSPEFLSVNPRGQVPVLVEGDLVLREGAAILIHILEKYRSPLLPSTEPARSEALQWLMFCNATLHPAYARVFFLQRSAEDQATKDQLCGVAVKMINKLWQEVEEKLGQSPYLCGSQATIADILLTVIANWSDHMPSPVSIGPRTKKLLQTIVARPSYQQALETEQVTYKAAA